MYTFFSIVFGLIWAVASFLLLFKVWDVLGPIVLGILEEPHRAGRRARHHLHRDLRRPRLVLGEALRLTRSPYMTPSP